MRFIPRGSQRGNFDIVVTSMLDINFLLIMFFLMTAQFQRETAAALNLPRERGEEKARIDEAGLVVNLSATGEIIISGRTIDLEALRREVQRQIETLKPTPANPLKLMVRADRRAPSERLNTVVTMLREMGVGVIRVATETPI